MWAVSLGGCINQYSYWLQDCGVDCSKPRAPRSWLGSHYNQRKIGTSRATRHRGKSERWGGRAWLELDCNALTWWTRPPHSGIQGRTWGGEQWWRPRSPWLARQRVCVWVCWKEKFIAFLSVLVGAVAHCHMVISRE